jgi:virginiamycin A acetyltransferase
MRTTIARAVARLFVVLVFPLALLSGFGRLEWVRLLFAQILALAPSLPGVYLRRAYYFLVQEKCSLFFSIGFGTFFAHRRNIVEPGVRIGAYCVIGQCRLGTGCRVATGAQILSGKQQHARVGDALVGENFQFLNIGRHCWIGAGAIVMDDVGDGATVGAGSVVTKPVPENAVYAGNPARDIRKPVGDRS